MSSGLAFNLVAFLTVVIFFLMSRGYHHRLTHKIPERIYKKKKEINTKEKNVSKLYEVISKQAILQKELEQIEDIFMYEYYIQTDEAYEDLLANNKEFRIKYAHYFAKLEEHKQIIKERVILERGFFNIKKGVYIGIGVDLLNIQSKEQEPTYIPWSDWENHAGVLGTTRYGKTYFLALIAYQMLLKGWDIILLDPKGGKRQELLSWMVEFSMLTNRSEDLVFINPGYINKSTLVNPIFGMGNSEIASVATLLSSGDGAAVKDDFFPSITWIATMGICTVFEYLEYVFDYDGTKTKQAIKDEMVRYHKIMNMQGLDLESYDQDTKVASPDASYRFGTIRETPEKISNNYIPFSRTLMTFAELSHYSNHENLKELYSILINTRMPDKGHFSDQRRYQKMIKARKEAIILLKTISELGEFYLKISMSIVALYGKLSTGEIGELFCTVRVNPLINRIRNEERGLIAIIQPAPLRFQINSDMMNKVLIKMFASIFGEVSLTGRGFKRRIGLLIDEAKIALFNGIEEIYNKAGGMGMTITIFMQSEQDAILKVGETAAKIISDNTNTHVYLKVNNVDSKENIVRSFGTRRKYTRTIMGQENLSRQTVLAEDEYMLNTNTIDKLGKGQAYVSSYGKKYLVQFPFMAPPAGEIIMPELEEEALMRDMVRDDNFIYTNISTNVEGFEKEKAFIVSFAKSYEKKMETEKVAS